MPKPVSAMVRCAAWQGGQAVHCHPERHGGFSQPVFGAVVAIIEAGGIGHAVTKADLRLGKIVIGTDAATLLPFALFRGGFT